MWPGAARRSLPGCNDRLSSGRCARQEARRHVSGTDYAREPEEAHSLKRGERFRPDRPDSSIDALEADLGACANDDLLGIK